MEKQEDRSYEAVRVVRRLFFVRPDESQEFSKLEKVISGSPPNIQPIGQAFKYNLHATLSSIGIPVTLASVFTEQLHFQRIHTAERIRQIPLPGDRDDVGAGPLPPAREEKAAQSARSKMAEFTASKEGGETLAMDACAFLWKILKQGELEVAAAELLRSGVALLWGALEVLARDLFVEYVNSHPSSIFQLLQDPATKKKFEPKAITLDLLAHH